MLVNGCFPMFFFPINTSIGRFRLLAWLHISTLCSSLVSMNEKSHDKTSSPKTVTIVGAGPAGLTAALELLRQEGAKGLKVVIVEADSQVGGLSRTVNYRGNRLDIGGHRFFSKVKSIMDWWLEVLPLAENTEQLQLSYQQQKIDYQPKIAAQTEEEEGVMLLRSRKSRIYYRQFFFDYPLKLSLDTLRKLGWIYSLKIALSYAYAWCFPRKPEKSLEDFFINRFGRKLYRTFFKEYTEKVWGVSCDKISAEWGSQRIKGLSVRKAIGHFVKQLLMPQPHSIYQKQTETSLIEQFLYPKYGPGQMWESVAQEIRKRGGEIYLQHYVETISPQADKKWRVCFKNLVSHQKTHIDSDYVISSMPLSELASALGNTLAPKAKAIAQQLPYRDFMVVGILLSKLKVNNLQDNWLYIQEPGIRMGRIQIFNNWSPAMVADPNKYWLGLEYFCYQHEAIWQQSDEEMINFATAELVKTGLASASDVEDATVLRVPKTYPAYYGSYEEFEHLRQALDRLDNLFLIGRNGMHRYNNQDHSMLTAMQAARNILENKQDKAAIWAINTEPEYHESQSS